MMQWTRIMCMCIYVYVVKYWKRWQRTSINLADNYHIFQFQLITHIPFYWKQFPKWIDRGKAEQKQLNTVCLLIVFKFHSWLVFWQANWAEQQFRMRVLAMFWSKIQFGPQEQDFQLSIENISHYNSLQTQHGKSPEALH